MIVESAAVRDRRAIHRGKFQEHCASPMVGRRDVVAAVAAHRTVRRNRIAIELRAAGIDRIRHVVATALRLGIPDRVLPIRAVRDHRVVIVRRRIVGRVVRERAVFDVGAAVVARIDDGRVAVVVVRIRCVQRIR